MKFTCIKSLLSVRRPFWLRSGSLVVFGRNICLPPPNITYCKSNTFKISLFLTGLFLPIEVRPIIVVAIKMSAHYNGPILVPTYWIEELYSNYIHERCPTITWWIYNSLYRCVTYST